MCPAGDGNVEAAAQADAGSKIGALLFDLAERRNRHTGKAPHKAVVFSQWGRFLDVTAAAMSRAGVAHVRLEGNANEQATALKTCSTSRSPIALLIGLRKGSAAGLTFNEATVVYLMEPSLNPGLEDQAIGRIHRIGQTQETACVRLVVKDSIEQHITDTRQKKRGLGDRKTKAQLETWKERTAATLDVLGMKLPAFFAEAFPEEYGQGAGAAMAADLEDPVSEEELRDCVQEVLERRSPAEREHVTMTDILREVEAELGREIRGPDVPRVRRFVAEFLDEIDGA